MPQFHSFVVFAEMRTGSNFLEANLNALAGVSCHGEAFNPHFIGYPGKERIFDITQAERDAAPLTLLQKIRAQDGLAGFRFFHDHDPRVLDAILDDPEVAKVILTRNPVDSYVSWKIAQATGQWKLTDAKRRKSAKAVFDADEFETHLEAIQSFQIKVLNRMQVSGQSAFYLDYDDLQSLDVINGLARFLGVSSRLEALDRNLKVQNPASARDNVSNPTALDAAIARLDRFNLTRTPNFEPRRPPAVTTYVAAPVSPLMYLPIKAGPEQTVRTWLAALDGMEVDQLNSRFTQKQLRQWMRRNPGHRSFTVLRHPVARAHFAFCRYILGSGAESYPRIRRLLVSGFGLPIPASGPDQTYDLDAHHAAFLAFIDFLRANLAGQTAIRVDGAWCTQSQALEGFGRFALPDRVIRERDMEAEFRDLARSVGCTTMPALSNPIAIGPFALADVYSNEIEARIRSVYDRDYMMFGFTDWME